MDENKRKQLLEKLERLQKLRNDIESMPDEEAGATASSAEKEPTMSEALFPRAMEQKEKGGGLLKTVGAGLLDMGSNIVSVPYAALTSGSQPEKLPTTSGKMTDVGGVEETKSFTKRLQEIKENKDDKIINEVVSDPANIVNLVPGAAFVKGGSYLAKYPVFSKWGKKIGKDLAQAGTSAGIHQAENVSEGKDVSLKEAALETASGGIGLLKDVARFAKNISQSAVAGLAKVDKDIIKKYGVGIGKNAKSLQEAVSDKYIQDNVTTALEYITDVPKMATPLREKLDEILKNSKPVDFQNFNKTYDKLMEDASIVKNLGEPTRNLLKKIKEDVFEITKTKGDIKGIENAKGQDMTFSVDKIRQQLDKYAGFDGVDAQARNTIVEALSGALSEDVKVAGGEEARQLFGKIHELMNSSGYLKKSLGLPDDLEMTGAVKKDPNNRDKVYQFLKKFYDEDATNRTEFLENLDKLFAGDLGKAVSNNNDNLFKGRLSERVKLTNEAMKLGPKGKPSWVPANPQTLGYLTAGGTVASASGQEQYASPAYLLAAVLAGRSRGAAGAYMAATDGMGKVARAGKNLVPTKVRDVAKQSARSAVFRNQEEDKESSAPSPFSYK